MSWWNVLQREERRQYLLMEQIHKHQHTMLAALERLEEEQHLILHELNRLTVQGRQTMATLADIQTGVAALQDVEQSVITLLDGISQQLKDAVAANDPVAMQKVIDDLDAQKQALADAVTRNTPAAP